MYIKKNNFIINLYWVKKNPFLLTIDLVLKFVGQKFDNKKSQSKSILLVQTKIIEHYIIDKKKNYF